MKKKIFSILTILLCSLIISLMLCTPSSAETIKETYRLGDVDGDSLITLADARLCLRAAIAVELLSQQQQKAADVYANGKIKTTNARKILRSAVGIEAIKENKNIVLKIGDSYSLIPLKNAGSGRYNWSYSLTPSSGIDVTEFTHIPDFPEGQTMPPGTPVEKTYTFTAKAPGVYKVYLSLADIMEDLPIDEIEFTITVGE